MFVYFKYHLTVNIFDQLLKLLMSCKSKYNCKSNHKVQKA